MVTETRNGETDDDGGGDSAVVGDGWRSEARRAIGGALLEGGRPLTPAEIAAHLRSDQSNVRKLAEQMVADGVLLRHKPPKRENGRGRQPRTAYSLADAQVAPLKARIEAGAEAPGRLRERQQLLLVKVEEGQEAHFFQIVENLEREAQPQWAGRIDGPKQPYLLAFEGQGAVQRAEVMRGALNHLEIECDRHSVSQLLSGKEFVESARDWLELVRSAVAGVAEPEAPWPPA